MTYAEKVVSGINQIMPISHTLDGIKGRISVVAPEQVNSGRILIQATQDWASGDDSYLAHLLEHVTGRAESNHATLKETFGLLPSNLLACSLCGELDCKRCAGRSKTKSFEMNLHQN